MKSRVLSPSFSSGMKPNFTVAMTNGIQNKACFYLCPVRCVLSILDAVKVDGIFLKAMCFAFATLRT